MIEKILSFSVHFRILAVLVTLAVATFGVFSLKKLPIDAVPDITNNQVQISVQAPALSPAEAERQVAFPIETAMAGIPGLVETRSLSRNGFSQITAIFDEDVDLYFARAQVSERLNQTKENLPSGADVRMGAVSTGLGEIYMWTVDFENPSADFVTPDGARLSDPLEKATYLRSLQDWVIRPQLKTVEGVAEIDAIGGYLRQYHVQPDPQKLAGLGLSFGDLIAAIDKNNSSIGAGYLDRNGEAFVVRANGRIAALNDLENIVIATDSGIPVYVRDVAKVRLGKELRTGSASEGGHEVVVGTAMMLKGENSRAVAWAVDAKIVEIRKTLPAGIVIKTVLNRTKLVDATIKTVQKNLLEGALLVVAVLFILLGNGRAALITALVIPITMLMTVAGMVRLGTSANLMSMGALDFGLIVDGAVIIVENCLRRLAERQSHENRLLTLSERLEEVMLASRQMIQPAVYGQAIIITVYLPLLTFTGVEGKMFEPMATTVILALVMAFILSLTFVPAMVALFITGKVEEKESVLISKAKSSYIPALEWALAHTKTLILSSVLFCLLSLILFSRLGQEFIPSLDEKDIAMHAMRIPSTSIAQSTAMQLQVEKQISTLPEVAFVYAKTGTAEMAADPMPPNVSDTFIILKPHDEWPDKGMNKQDFLNNLAAAVAKVPGNNYEFTQPIQMRFNELISGVRSDVAVKIYGDDFAAMEKSADGIAAALRSVAGAADVKVEQISGLPILELSLNRDMIARHGLSAEDILDLIGVSIGGREAGFIFEGDKRVPIIVQLSPDMRANIAALEDIPVPVRNGGDRSFIPLRQFVSFDFAEGPNQISRENGKRRVVVQANVRGRDIGSFVNDAKALIENRSLVPSGYWLDWGGQFENLTAARDRLMIVVPACFFLIFLMLFTALGSMRYAALVFSGVPLAISGGILTLYLRDMPFSIPAAVGFIALSGIAVLNGLVMVSYINQLVRDGMNVADAVREGAITRLRPVLMTALVASLGFVPMALSSGTGAEVQKPLATVVIGGLITATLLTLIVLPALYERLSVREEQKGDFRL